MRREDKVSDQNIKTIIARYSSGESSEKIAKDLGIDGRTVCRILKRNNIQIRPATENKKKLLTKKEDYFSNIDSADKSYFLGLMFSDGNVRTAKNDVKICLLKSDKKVLSLFSYQIFGFEHLSYDEESQNHDDMCRFNVTSERMKQDLIKLGCVPNKTFKITFQQFPFILHRKKTLHFRGGMNCAQNIYNFFNFL